MTTQPRAPICTRCAPRQRRTFSCLGLVLHRQLTILRLVFQGFQNQEIEVRLKMTPSAVKSILQQLFSKADAKNRSQLVRVALERYRDLL